jgi:hypothetical protein
VSQTLSGMVREMHNGLFATIDSEQSPFGTFTHYQGRREKEKEKRKRKREKEKKRREREEKKRAAVNSSYTPVSQTLSGMVREMHNGLFATIDSEQSPLVLLHTIKVEEKKRKRKRI